MSIQFGPDGMDESVYLSAAKLRDDWNDGVTFEATGYVGRDLEEHGTIGVYLERDKVREFAGTLLEMVNATETLLVLLLDCSASP